jgi:hypothetical protein
MSAAGGFNPAGLPGLEPGDLLDLQSSYQSMWVEYATEHVRRARIEAELLEDTTFSIGLPDHTPLPDSMIDSIVESEREALATSLADAQQARGHVEQQIADADAQMSVLSQRERAEAAAVEADEEQLALLESLLADGRNTNARVGEVRRGLLMSSSRRLETTVELMRLRQQKLEASRQLQRDANDRKIALLRDLTESNARLGDLGVRLRAAAEKLELSASSPVAGGRATPMPGLTIVRKVGDSWEQWPVGPDFELLPRDVVEVSRADAPLPRGQSDPGSSTARPLRYAPNENFEDATYLPGLSGFNLADVSIPAELDLLPEGVQALVWVGMCDGVTERFRERVEPFLGRHEVFGYYLTDEPDPTGKWSRLCTAESLREQSDWIHDRSPQSKTFIVLMNLGSAALPSYQGAYTNEKSHVDLVGINPYPCRSELNGCDFGSIHRTVKAAEAAGYTRDQMVPVFQTFGEGDFETDGGGRYLLPTASQLEAMLSIWRRLLPGPEFEFSYSWGVQANTEALATTPDLRSVMLRHNFESLEMVE